MQARLCKLDVVADIQQRLVDVGAEVVAWLQISDEVNAAPEASAADIEQLVVGLEAMLGQHLELKGADLVPPSAYDLTVAALRDTRVHIAAVVVSIESRRTHRCVPTSHAGRAALYHGGGRTVQFPCAGR